ncbi:MAG TPA: U32 family peptidase [Desulfomonilia bacterium]|nr:U32 family peptidase [Desulfomonilia bacterium]
MSGQKRTTKMKIMAPFNTPKEIGDLIECGSTELYTGLNDEEWLRKYPIAGINRRVELKSNLNSFKELERAVSIAHSYRTKVELTLNEHYYTQAQYPLLLEYVRKAIDTGIDALIVSDISLILVLKEQGLDVPLHLSTGGAVFNSEAALFFGKLGISRITIPRHVTLQEISSLIDKIPMLETAVFILNSRCANIDGLCTFDHLPYKCPDPGKFLGPEVIKQYPEQVFSKDIIATGACMLPYVIEMERFTPSLHDTPDVQQQKRETVLKRQQLWIKHHIDNIPCGACAMYDLHHMGVTAVKIVGRGYADKRKIGDIRFITMLLDLLDSGIPRDEFMKVSRNLYMTNYNKPCRSINCYYPEVLPKEYDEVTYEE